MILRPCVECGRAVERLYRGRCATHRQTTAQRGYDRAHRQERAAALPGASCERCGCKRDLQRDHRDPTLRGAAREQPSNKRWLCDCAEHRCHSRSGLRRGARGGEAGQIFAARRSSGTFAPFGEENGEVKRRGS